MDCKYVTFNFYLSWAILPDASSILFQEKQRLRKAQMMNNQVQRVAYIDGLSGGFRELNRLLKVPLADGRGNPASNHFGCY